MNKVKNQDVGLFDYERKFPEELLSASGEEKIGYFRGITVAHPKLAQVRNRIWRAITDSVPGTIIMVFGPSGVGKTTVCDHLDKSIRQKFGALYEKNRELIPLVKIEASNSVTGSFDWKHYFQELLVELGEIAVDHKMCLPVRQAEAYLKAAWTPQSSCATLRTAAEAALRHRSPKGVLIDEAQHMCTTTSARRLVNQPNSIKSLAGRTKTHHVLFGTYDLLELRNLNGQLARRVIEIHFERYNIRLDKDVEVFKNILRQFQSHLPVKRALDLAANWELIYSRCLGCIGILKETLNRALSMALDEESTALEMKHLEASLLRTSQASYLFEDIMSGEAKLEGDRISQDDLLNKLKYGEPEDAGNERDSGKDRNSKKGNRNPGVRNPKRDAVGAA